MKDLTIVIPSFNEAENLRALLPEWLAFCEDKKCQLFIIDDGSTDDTRLVLDQFKKEEVLKVFHHKINSGYGAAIKTGIRHTETDYLVTMDADGQHPVEEISDLARALKEKDADMVVGKRRKIYPYSIYRVIGKSLIRFTARCMMRIPIKDINSGIKLYSTGLAKKYTQYCPDSMAYSDVITLTFISMGCFVTEHPVTVKPRRFGKSTVNTFSALETFRSIFWIVLLFNPLRIFLPFSLLFIFAGVGWSIPFLLSGEGISIGSSLLIITGVLIFFMGILADQISEIKRGLLSS